MSDHNSSLSSPCSGELKTREKSYFKTILNIAYSLPNNKILDWSKFKAIADNNIDVTENFKFVLERV